MAAFTRTFELESVNILLNIDQNIEGDVSCVVWDAALVLSAYIDCENKINKNYLRDKNVIELGSGVGCVSLTAACLGAHVIATDLPAVIPHLEKNLLANQQAVMSSGGSVTARDLEWSENNSDLAPPDVILLSDCVYYEKALQPLVEVLCSLSGPNTEVLISQELRESATQRALWAEFRERMDDIFDVALIPRHRQHPVYFSSDIVLMKLSKKK